MKMTDVAKEQVKIGMGTLLQLGSILAITVLSFALVKAQANENSRNIERNHTWNEKSHESIELEAEKLEGRVRVNEASTGRIEQNQKEILRRLDENKEYYGKLHDEVIGFIMEFEVVN